MSKFAVTAAGPLFALINAIAYVVIGTRCNQPHYFYFSALITSLLHVRYAYSGYDDGNLFSCHDFYNMRKMGMSPAIWIAAFFFLPIATYFLFKPRQSRPQRPAPLAQLEAGQQRTSDKY